MVEFQNSPAPFIFAIFYLFSNSFIHIIMPNKIKMGHAQNRFKMSPFFYLVLRNAKTLSLPAPLIHIGNYLLKLNIIWYTLISIIFQSFLFFSEKFTRGLITHTYMHCVWKKIGLSPISYTFHTPFVQCQLLSFIFQIYITKS